MHYRERSEIHGACSGSALSKCTIHILATDTCGHFNAPTGIYWVPEWSLDHGREIIRAWRLRRKSDANACGFEHLGKLKQSRDGWVALRHGQPVLVWKHSEDALTRCAESLVDLARKES